MATLTSPGPIAVDPLAAPLRVVLYTRTLCCCCQTAREVLEEYRQAGGIEVEEVDATDPALEMMIGPTVPVVAIDGKVRFRGEVNRVLLDRMIAARAIRE